MIWMYTVKENEFRAIDVTSLTQLLDIASKQWIWVDIYTPNDRETEIISELLGNKPEIVDQIKKWTLKPLNVHQQGCEFCDYKTINDYVIVTIPSLSMKEEPRINMIVLAKKKNVFITWGESSAHSSLIKLTIKRLRERVEEGVELNSSLVISMLFREVATNNSDVMLSIREKIDQMEEQALEKGGKRLIHSVFSLKKTISALYRVMLNGKNFMLLIPMEQSNG